MNRRSVLAAAGCSFLASGCLGSLPGAADPVDCSGELPDRPESADPSGEVLRDVTITDVSGPGHGLDADVALERGAITTDHTAALWIRVTNATASRREVTFGMRPPFSATSDATGTWGLSSESELDDRLGPDCWATEYGHGIDHALQGITLGRCESLGATFYLSAIASPDDEVCMPTGAFEFERAYDLPDDERAKWDFTLSVEEP